MSIEPSRGWLLLDYKAPVKLWISEYTPSLPVILAVRAWLRSRETDPFAGIRYVPGIEDYFFGIVPGTLGTDGRVVTCAYWVQRDDRLIRIDIISTVSWPV